MAPPAAPLRAALLVSLMGLLAGCRPAQPPLPPTPSLPPPRLEHSTLEPIPTLPPTPSPSPLPTDLAGLAQAAFGPRLITQIHIPALNLLAPVTPVGWEPTAEAAEWDSPDAQVGWAISSALPGDAQGDIILYGHNNIHSSVFRNLADLQSGDTVTLETGEGSTTYQISEVVILPILGEGADTDAYAALLQPGLAPRLLLISCWPPTSNTHRVLVIAYPSR